MRTNIQHFTYAVVVYLCICILSITVLKPFSIVNFVGPAAAAASAIVIMWGSRGVFSVIFGTILFDWYLSSFQGVKAELSILFISLLSICLQSLWAKQLTYKYISHQKWLNSRSLLFSFLIKVGPLAGIVSASTSVLVALLDAKILAGSLGYAFFSGWAGSILVAIFLTPTLLFTQGEQKLTLSKRFFIILASFLACISIGLLFVISQKAHQHQRMDAFNEAKSLIQTNVNDELALVRRQVISLAALFSANERVSEEQFIIFSKKISEKNTSIRAIEWLPFVSDYNRSSFEAFASKELSIPFNIVEQTDLGEVEISSQRSLYLPTYYIYPYHKNAVALGLDLYNNEDTIKAINQAAQLNQLVASPSLNLIHDDFSTPAIYVFYPVYNVSKERSYGELVVNEQLLAGYVLAVVQFKTILSNVNKELLKHNINFSIADLTSSTAYFIYGENRSSYNTLFERFYIDMFSRKWQVDVFENQTWNVQTKTWQTWSLLIGGTFGGMFFQVLILMMAAYSTELSNQVNLKTRELISSKELSDTENHSKSQFMAKLAVEFTSLINTLNEIVLNYKDKVNDVSESQHFSGVSNTVKSLEYLVSNLNDLNSIESGKLTINNQKLNLHQFISDIEQRLKTTADIREQSLIVLVGKNVPQLVEADENRLEQLLITMMDNAFSLLGSNELRLTVKAHLHKLASTSVFFVFTTNNTSVTEKNSILFNNEINSELENYNTAMAMVKELCVLLGGDAKMVTLPTGDAMISLSIKVILSSHEFQKKIADRSTLNVNSKT